MSGEKRLTLQNRDGKELCVIFREYRYGDETGIIDCIRNEYGNTYPKAGWYSKTAIMENAVKERVLFVMVQLPEGELIGTTAFAKTVGKIRTTYEIAAQVIQKTYRGYGIAQSIFEYGLDLLWDKAYSAVYSQPVLFHDITQRLLSGLGLTAAGIVQGRFDLNVLRHSYDNGRNTKMPLGIQVKAKYRQNAGCLYLPKRHRDFCAQRYQELGVDYEIMDIPNGGYEKMPAAGSISYQYDRKHKYTEIYIFAVGADFERQIKLLLLAYPLKGKNTVNVFLNINDRYAVMAYEWLAEKGFFFTGLKPLCGDNEYMIMHHPGETQFYLEDLKLNMEFENIAQYIEKEKMK